MNKETGRLQQLYKLSMNEEASAAELQEMADLLLMPEHKVLADDLLFNAYMEPKDIKDDVSLSTRLAILQAIFAADRSMATQPVVKQFPFKIWMAAAVLLIAGALAILVNSSRFNGNASKYNGIAAINDIDAGKNGATLTLADGRKIRLSDAVTGKLATEAGVSIVKTREGQLQYSVLLNQQGKEKATFNTLSTARGEMYQVVLPDGSKVWLNASSSLKYPSSFTSVKERRVELVGEAYFEISKVFRKGQKERLPFMVVTKGQSVEVLGTHFNINSYADEPNTKTTLLEGSIRVNPSDVILKPGEQAVVSKTGAVKVGLTDLEGVMAWKNGDFIFSPGDDLKSAMRKIARWYDVEVIYDASAPLGMEPRGWISRKNKLSAVLSRIESTGKVHFKIEGRRVTVMR
ncbi:FecR domain-containing protein [Pedobacter sp. MC2016-14]|uniref:FecR family protein n=1 Tax=Pedobacter sp. MC2016-14 TaxID=2897327 RepID=UPI001E58FDAC|nr:FecR family protein [Pedobacter sp. MC2016-14]MCD0486832.1 FecR domain-containing protein [Pedobacter sp. MC2016-14]